MATIERVEIAELINRQRIGGYQIGIVVVCALMLMVDGFDTQMIGFAGPAITTAFQVDKSALGPLLAAGIAGLMVGALVIGIAADRLGRKFMVLACLVIFGVFTLAAAFVSSLGALTALRFLAGIGLGGIIPNGVALVSEYSPRRHHATLVTLLNAGFSIGAALAGLGARLLLPNYGWQSLFIVGGLLPLVLLPVGWFLLPESARLLALRGDKSEQVRRIMRRVSPQTALTANATFVSSEENTAGSKVKHLFTNGRTPITSLLWLSFFANLLVLYFLAGWMPTAMVSRGLPTQTAVTATALIYLGGVIGSLLLGWLMDRFGSHTVLATCSVLAAILLGVIAGAGTNAPVIMIAAAITGFCVVGGQNGLNAYAGVLYPTFVRSTGVGWALGIGRIGGVLGPLLVGGLFALNWTVSSIFVIAIIPPIIGAVALLMLGSTAARRAG
ncbi:MAG TPA: MFS transporter [Stellaceae bacterium]|nr:MFS transporter [Stellaceae bacterium]